MNVLALDDEELQLIRLVKSIQGALPEAKIYSFQDPLDALKICETTKMDIAFLDIEMPEMNGLFFAKRLQKLNKTVNIIFVSAYQDYASEAYSMHASGYLVKPPTVEKVKEEIENLRHPVSIPLKRGIQVQCFGNFEVWCDGKPLSFAYSKSKEVFAYLVDRAGASVSVGELNAVMWEDRDHHSYLRNLIADIQRTFKSVGHPEVFIKRRGGCSIDISKIDCDAYQYRNNDPSAIRKYRGEYMAQYPWAIFEYRFD